MKLSWPTIFAPARTTHGNRGGRPWFCTRRTSKSFLKNAFFLAFFVWGLTLLVFLLALAPVAALVTLFPGTAGFLTVVIAVVFAWAVKAAVIEPFAMAALMQVFVKVTDGQSPDPEWEGRLDKVSSKFGELRDRAAGRVGAGEPGESGPGPEPNAGR